MTGDHESGGERLTLGIGAISDPIIKQLQAQGCTADVQDLARWEKFREAINRLSFAGLLSDGETEKARQRLFRKILRGVYRVKKARKGGTPS